MNNVFKRLEFVKYSNTHKGWYIPQNRKLLHQVIDALTTIATVDIKDLKLSPQMYSQKIVLQSKAIQSGVISIHNTEQLQLMLQTLVLTSYIAATVRTYKNEFSIYLQTLKGFAVDSLTTQRLKDYLQYCFETLQLTENTIHTG